MKYLFVLVTLEKKNITRPVSSFSSSAFAMASIAAAAGAAAALGVWYTARKSPTLSDFTEPPKTWGESVVRLHEVVRVSWKEALSKLGIWRLDHLLAIRHLSSRDMSLEIAEEVLSMGVQVVGTEEWRLRLEFIDLAMRYNRLLRGARSVEQIQTKLEAMIRETTNGNDTERSDPGVDENIRETTTSETEITSASTSEPPAILLSQLRPAILQPAYILVKDPARKALFFVIRGTHSVRDTVTSLTAHSKPHHLVDGNGSVVLGRAHAGFLSTARWLAKTVKNDLLRAMSENADYELTIVGHSLGAGTAVVLTQILRELDGGDTATNKFANTQCLAFACPSALSADLSEACKPFVTTVITGADIVPTVSFSKVTELQQQIVSAAWEQQVLKKWRATTRAMARACAAPREGKGRVGNGDANRSADQTQMSVSDQAQILRKDGVPITVVDPYQGSLLSRVPGALTCGFGGRRGGYSPVPLTAEEAVVSSVRFRVNAHTEEQDDDARLNDVVGQITHLPGAAAPGSVLRPRRWLGAQMRSLRMNLRMTVPLRAAVTKKPLPMEGSKLTKLASLGTALLASCVAPRKPERVVSNGGSSKGSSAVPGGTPPDRVGPMEKATDGKSSLFSRSSFKEARASPTLAQTASLEAARASAASHGGTRPSSGAAPGRNDLDPDEISEENEFDGDFPDDGVLSDDLRLDDDDKIGSRDFLEQLEGEAAQEVLKLQEELAVIQAAGDGDGFGAVGCFESDESEDDGVDRTSLDGSDARDGVGDHENNTEITLPTPKTTKSDPAALLGPGAPLDILEAARSIGRDEGTSDNDEVRAFPNPNPASLFTALPCVWSTWPDPFRIPETHAARSTDALFYLSQGSPRGRRHA